MNDVVRARNAFTVHGVYCCVKFANGIGRAAVFGAAGSCIAFFRGRACVRFFFKREPVYSCVLLYEGVCLFVYLSETSGHRG